MNTTTQLSGPSALWSIIPLAFNVMLQHSGRPCGFHLHSRTYLEAIPLVCAADTLSILFRVCTDCMAGFSVRHSANLALESRYRCCEYCSGSLPGDTLQDLESSAALRFIVFVFGALPSALKLFSVQGIPWTQAWASMYLINFFTVEALLLIRKAPITPVPVQFETIEEAKGRLQQRWEKQISPVHKFIGLAAWNLSSTLPFFLVLNGAMNRADSTHPKIWIFPLALFNAVYCHTLQYKIEEGSIRKYVDLMTFPLASWVLVFLKVIRTIQIAYFIPGVGVFLWLAQRRAFHDFDLHWQNILVYMPIGLVLPVSIAPQMLLLALKSKAWRSNIDFLPANSENTDIIRELEVGAVAIFGSVLTMFMHAFVWYGLMYNPENTHKPGWAEWLG